MTSRTRSRVVVQPAVFLGTYKSPLGTQSQYTGTGFFKDTCDDELHSGPPYLKAGPLAISQRRIVRGYTASGYSNYSDLYTYRGKFYTAAWIPSPAPTMSSIGGWGAVGWNRAVPVRPVARLGTALLELRDLPRMLTQTWRFFQKLPPYLSFAKKGKTVGDLVNDLRLSGSKGLSSDYLNLEFGWLPFVSDLVDAINAKTRIRKKLAYLKRNMRKNVHRKVNLEDYEESLDFGKDGGSPPLTTLSPILASQIYSGSSEANRRTYLRKYSRKTWFTATFTYYIPELDLKADDPLFGTSPIERHILGLELSPSTIYKAVPWTWLLDWFTNAGSVVENMELTSRYHVVTRRACVMMREHYDYIVTGAHTRNLGRYTTVPAPVTRREVATTVTTYDFKQRQVANPYGFGVLDADLSAYQWSILAALGLSRLR